MPLPQGYVPVRDAASAADGSSFLGVLIHVRDPFQFKPGEWTLEFTIQDEFSPGSVGGPGSLLCRVLRRKREWLPNPGSPGDLVAARYMRLNTRNTQTVAFTTVQLKSEVQFYPAKTIPAPAFSTPYSLGGHSIIPWNGTYCAQNPSAAEQMAIIHLKAATDSFLPEIKMFAANAGPPKGRPKNDKKTLIRDLTIGKYHDLVGEVVKMFYPDYTTMDLYVTDYTENKALFLYEDPDEADEADADFGLTSQKKWAGPFGQVTIAIRLWEPHASWVRDNVKEGDLLFLQNVHAKLSNANKLEGAIHQDQKYPDKICTRKCTNARQIEDHATRKAAYLDAIEAQKAKRALAQNIPKKPSAKASAKKKEEKKERQRLQKEQEQKELEKKAEELSVARAGVNPHVRASHPEVQLSTVSEILYNPALKTKNPKGGEFTLPFVNAKYRTRVRVVDCFPQKLEQFVRELSDPRYHTKPMPAERKARLKGRWEWHFLLLVEDAEIPAGTKPVQLSLTVGNSAAQHLLKMDAVDLTKNPKVLKKLEEKMFILWGNLMERKTSPAKQRAKLQNLPFDCVVHEHGHQVGGNLERVHTLNSTTIMD